MNRSVMRVVGVIIAALLLGACGAAPTPGTEVAVSTPLPSPSSSPPLAEMLDPTGQPTLDDSATIAALQTVITATELAPLTSTPIITPPPTITPTSLPAPDLPEVFVRGAAPSRSIARLGTGSISSYMSPDDTLLALETSSAIYMLSARTGEQIWQQALHGPVEMLEWSPDSQYVAVSLFEWGNVLVWARDGRLVSRLENENEVVSFAWSPDSKRIVVGMGSTSLADRYDSCRAVAVWEAETARRLWITPAETGDSNWPSPVYGIAWSPDNHVIAATDIAGVNIVLLDAQDGSLLHELISPGVGNQEVMGLRFSPDGSSVLAFTDYGPPSDTPGGNSRIAVWDVEEGEIRHILQHPDVVVAASWSPDGRSIITEVRGLKFFDDVPAPHYVYIWDAADGTVLRILHGDDLVVSTLRWSEDGSEAISVDGRSGQIILWDTTTWIGQPQGFFFPRLGDFVEMGYLTPGPIVWSANTDGPRYRISTFRMYGYYAAWSPDGSQVAMIPIDDTAGTLTYTWEIATGSLVGVATSDHPPEGWDATFHAGADYDLYSSGVDGIANHEGTLWATTIQDEWVQHPVTSIIVQDADSGEVLHAFEEEGNFVVRSLSFSPDSRYLAVGHTPPERGAWSIRAVSIDNAFVSIYDLQTGQKVRDLIGHTGGVYEISWSPDGRTLATSSFDGTVILWDVSDLP